VSQLRGAVQAVPHLRPPFAVPHLPHLPVPHLPYTDNVLARKRLLPTKSFNLYPTYFRFGLVRWEISIMSPYLPGMTHAYLAGLLGIARGRVPPESAC
jgi:hypothetical protein